MTAPRELDPFEDTREQLRHLLPAFSHFFGIQPWDIDQLTFSELEVYLSEIAALQQKLKENGG